MDDFLNAMSELDWIINLIAIPLLIIGLLIALYYVFKPREKNYLLKLYTSVNEMISIIEDSCNAKTIKILYKKVEQALYFCDCLLGGDMYELENIVASLTKASNILSAMIAAKIPVHSYREYMPRVKEQIEHCKGILSSFYMEDTVEELKMDSLNPKKNAQTARDYLDDLKS